MPSPTIALPQIAAPRPITTFVPSAFNVPTPKLPDMTGMLQRISSAVSGTGNGSGTGGNGNGSGNGQDGDGHSLTGLHIGTDEVLVAVMDVSASMEQVIKAAKEQLAHDYPGTPVVESTSAKGATSFEAYGAPLGTGRILHVTHVTEPTVDLYMGITVALGNHPGTTALYLITDFEDGDTATSTQGLIDTLKLMHI